MTVKVDARQLDDVKAAKLKYAVDSFERQLYLFADRVLHIVVSCETIDLPANAVARDLGARIRFELARRGLDLGAMKLEEIDTSLHGHWRLLDRQREKEQQVQAQAGRVTKSRSIIDKEYR